MPALKKQFLNINPKDKISEKSKSRRQGDILYNNKFDKHYANSVLEQLMSDMNPDDIFDIDCIL